MGILTASQQVPQARNLERREHFLSPGFYQSSSAHFPGSKSDRLLDKGRALVVKGVFVRCDFLSKAGRSHHNFL